MSYLNDMKSIALGGTSGFGSGGRSGRRTRETRFARADPPPSPVLFSQAQSLPGFPNQDAATGGSGRLGAGRLESRANRSARERAPQTSALNPASADADALDRRAATAFVCAFLTKSRESSRRFAWVKPLGRARAEARGGFGGAHPIPADAIALDQTAGLCAVKLIDKDFPVGPQAAAALGAAMAAPAMARFEAEGLPRRFSACILFDPYDRIGSEGLEFLSEIRRPRFEAIQSRALRQSGLDFEAFDGRDLETLSRKGFKKLRPHQIRAVDAAEALLRQADRAKLIMPCGSGKTLCSARLMDRLVGDGEVGAFFFPSLALLAQTLKEAAEQSERPFEPLVVCSDKTIGRGGEAPGSAPKAPPADLFSGPAAEAPGRASQPEPDEWAAEDLPTPPTTDAETLARELKRLLPGLGQKLPSAIPRRVLLFATYQSVDALIGAQRILGFDLKAAVFDEAHRIAGLDQSGGERMALCPKIHGLAPAEGDDAGGVDDLSSLRARQAALRPAPGSLRCLKRLYMTATPKIYGQDDGDGPGAQPGGAKPAPRAPTSRQPFPYGMDDERIFGATAFSMSFGEAIAQGLLCDYELIVALLRETDLIPWARELRRRCEAHSRARLERERQDAAFWSQAARPGFMSLRARRGGAPREAGETEETGAADAARGVGADARGREDAEREEREVDALWGQVYAAHMALSGRYRSLLRPVPSPGAAPQPTPRAASRAIAFSRSIALSQQRMAIWQTLSRALSDGGAKSLAEVSARHVDGGMGQRDKAAALRWLEGSDGNDRRAGNGTAQRASPPSPGGLGRRNQSGPGALRVLGNARCLTEGVDVGGLDGVVIFDGRSSDVDVIQAVGRAVRAAPGKSLGRIVIPLVAREDEENDPDAFLAGKAFLPAAKARDALAAHDKRLLDPQFFASKFVLAAVDLDEAELAAAIEAVQAWQTPGSWCEPRCARESGGAPHPAPSRDQEQEQEQEQERERERRRGQDQAIVAARRAMLGVLLGLLGRGGGESAAPGAARLDCAQAAQAALKAQSAAQAPLRGLSPEEALAARLIARPVQGAAGGGGEDPGLAAAIERLYRALGRAGQLGPLRGLGRLYAQALAGGAGSSGATEAWFFCPERAPADVDAA